MKLSAISEANLATTAGQSAAGRTGASVGDFAKAAGQQALGVAADMVPGVAAAKAVGGAAIQIFNLIRNRQKATNFINQAMSLPDNSRTQSNIFDVDDGLWDPNTGVLSQPAKLAILQLVETELTKYISSNQIPPANFANNIALQYLKTKVKF